MLMDVTHGAEVAPGLAHPHIPAADNSNNAQAAFMLGILIQLHERVYAVHFQASIAPE